MTWNQIFIKYDKFSLLHQVAVVVFPDNNDVYRLNTLTFISLIVILNAEKVNFSH